MHTPSNTPLASGAPHSTGNRSGIQRLRSWWWPTFIFFYPLLLIPPFLPAASLAVTGPGFFTYGVLLHLVYMLVFCLGGLVLELLQHPNTRLKDIRHVGKWLWNNKPIATAWLLGIWSLVSTVFSDDPPASLTGGGYDALDSAVWLFALIIVLTLVYIRSRYDNSLAARCVGAAIASAVLLASVGLAEVFVGRNLLIPGFTSDVPITNFPQKGHLAGWLAVACAASFAIRSKWALYSMLILGLVIGTTTNRAALLAISVIALLAIITSKEKYQTLWRTALVVLVCALGVMMSTIVHKQQSKQLQSTVSAISRSYLWTAAYRGILAHPITGWGGGQFYRHWPKFLSAAELNGFTQSELGETFVRREGYIIFTQLPDGTTAPRIWTAWKAHNQILDISIAYGIPGGLLYISLIVMGLINARTLPLRLAVLAYSTFMLFWFAIPHSEGAVWALWALALAGPARDLQSGNQS